METNRSWGNIGSRLFVAVVLLVVTGAGSALAQGTGRIVGTVTNAETGQPIQHVQITIEGTGLGAVSGQRGTYSIANVPAGSRTVVFSILGYETLRQSASVQGGATATVDVSMVTGFLEMGEIAVVGASRTPTRIVEAPAAVSVVSPEDLQREGGHGQLPKLFSNKPGVDVVQSGIQDFNINARGFNSSLNRRVLVLQDGVDRSLGFLQSQEWTSLSMPLDDLGRLEMVRGPGSALYGANAFSGVINITTPAPGDVIGTKVSVAGGQRETGRFDIRHGAMSRSGRVGFKGNFGIVSVGDGFSQSRTFGDAVAPCNPANGCTFEYGPLPVEPVPISDDPIRSVYGGARVDLNLENGSVWSNEGGWTRVENEIFITGIGRVQVNGANRPWFRSEYASERFNVMGWYSGRRSDETDEDGNNQTALASGAQLRETSDIFHLEGQTNWKTLEDRLQLVLGASNRWVSIDTDGTLMEEKKDDTITSVFGQFEFALHPTVTVLAAARWDRFSVLEADENEVSPKAAIVFKPNPNNSVRVTFNRAFQVPNYSELFLRVPAGVPADLTPLEAGLEQAISAELGVPVDLPLNLSAQTPVLALGNDALRAEQLTGYEVGWKGSLAKGRVFVTADVYFNTIEDFVTDLLPGVNPDFEYQLPAAFGAPPLNQVAAIVQGTLLEQTGGAIATLPNGATALVVSYTNAGEVDENGVELGVAFLPAPNLEVSANYTYFNFDVKKAEEGDALLPNTPENKVNFGIVYDDPAGLTVGAKVHAQDAMEWAAGVFGGHVPGYATVDLNAGWQATPYARFNLFWVNVLDKEHYQLYGGSILGSRAIGGVTLTF